MKRTGQFFLLAFLLCPWPRLHAANPYLAKPGETSTTIRVATCAISGGFMHLYTAVDNRLFEKYGLKVEFLLIRGAGVSVAALPTVICKRIFSPSQLLSNSCNLVCMPALSKLLCS